jgi:hypothetical protein
MRARFLFAVNGTAGHGVVLRGGRSDLEAQAEALGDAVVDGAPPGIGEPNRERRAGPPFSLVSRQDVRYYRGFVATNSDFPLPVYTFLY